MPDYFNSDCKIFTDLDGSLHGKKNSLCVNIPGRGPLFKITTDRLTEGAVFDDSEGSLTLRMWVAGDKIYILHLFGHDVAWPNTVYEFNRSLKGRDDLPWCVCPQEIHQLHEFLGRGNGIPPALK